MVISYDLKIVYIYAPNDHWVKRNAIVISKLMEICVAYSVVNDLDHHIFRSCVSTKAKGSTIHLNSMT